MDPKDVTKQLFETADEIDGSGISAYFGNGRVNAFRKVNEQEIDQCNKKRLFKRAAFLFYKKENALIH